MVALPTGREAPAWYATCYDSETQRNATCQPWARTILRQGPAKTPRALSGTAPAAETPPAETVAPRRTFLLDYYKESWQVRRRQRPAASGTSCGYWVEFFGEASIAEATKTAAARSLHRPT